MDARLSGNNRFGRRLAAFCSVVLLAGIAASGSPPSAGAFAQCGADSGTYSDLQEITLYYSWNYFAEWDSLKDFVALRYDIYSNETLHHYQDASTFGDYYNFANTDSNGNPVNVYAGRRFAAAAIRRPTTTLASGTPGQSTIASEVYERMQARGGL